MSKRRRPEPRRGELEITDALITVHADPAVRSRDRRLFRAAQRRLSQRSNAYLARQNVR